LELRGLPYFSLGKRMNKNKSLGKTGGTSVEIESSSHSCERASSCCFESSVLRFARMVFRRPLLEPKPGGRISSNPAPSWTRGGGKREITKGRVRVQRLDAVF
jgi:hypothetical protein